MTIQSLMNGPVGGFARFFCFDKNTPITMQNNTTKNISNIKINDHIKDGGKVLSVLEFDSQDVPMYNYFGTLVSSSHLVMEDNKWIRVEDSKSSSCTKINNYKGNIYCLITENNLININNILYRDFIETKDIDINTYIKNLILSSLNNNRSNITLKDKNYLCGFHPLTEINFGNFSKKIKDIKIGDSINGNKIIGKILQYTDKTTLYNINNVLVTGDQIINSNGSWDLVHNNKYKSFSYNGNIYNFITEDGTITLNNTKFTDYSETSDPDVNDIIDSYVENFLN